VHLQELTILNFKNYETAELSFDEKVNCLVGINGSGKTNLLDAIYYLAFSKSFFNPSDTQNIFLEEAFFSVSGTFMHDLQKEKINCSIKKGHKKVVNRNGKNYERFANHIGLIPLVMISPIDILLVVEGSEGRRKWLDGLISQFDKTYLDYLLSYNKVLLQRNALLKQIRASRQNHSLLELYNDQLVDHGKFIYDRRCDLMRQLAGYFNDYYKYISNSLENVDIEYTSHLHDSMSFSDQLEASVQKDLAVQYTTVGIHKDDIEFTIEGRPVKKFASQGQQKSVLLSLRLAQAKLIQEKKGMKPLMLLDDIYDKLDAFRMSRLLELLNTDDFGQLFITDTNRDHMKELLNGSNMKGKFFKVENGQVSAEEPIRKSSNLLN
jgi:DNA replication and repair protein RecF